MRRLLIAGNWKMNCGPYDAAELLEGLKEKKSEIDENVDAPDFSFVTMEGDTVNNQSLNGSTYIIEISPLANFEYQNDYDRTMEWQ